MNDEIRTGGPAALLHREGWLTIADAAREIDRSPSTVRRWIKSGDFVPQRVKCGDLDVAVFDDKDIERLREHAGSVRMGRPPVGLKRQEKK